MLIVGVLLLVSGAGVLLVMNRILWPPRAAHPTGSTPRERARRQAQRARAARLRGEL